MTTLPTDSLDLIILLFKNVQNRQLVRDKFNGILGEDIDFHSVVDILEEKDFLVEHDPNSRQIECSFVNTGFYKDLDSFLLNANRRVKSPSRFYLADFDYLHKVDELVVPASVLHYLQATKLFVLLEKLADHTGSKGNEKTLIFLNKNKVEITSEYGKDDLHDLTGLSDFEKDFSLSETHKEQKQTIIKTALLELFEGRNGLKFSELLAKFSDFVEKVQANYDLYIAEFSFQRVKHEVEKEKLEAMVKLNKVFSDIQNQLLAVPAALVLIGGQMQNTGHFEPKNALIWFGALIFALFMDLLVRNQRHTLEAVNNEIEQQRNEIKTKYHAVAERFKSIYDEINVRYKHQKLVICVVEALVGLSFLVATGMLLWFSGMFA